MTIMLSTPMLSTPMLSTPMLLILAMFVVRVVSAVFARLSDPRLGIKQYRSGFQVWLGFMSFILASGSLVGIVLGILWLVGVLPVSLS